MLKLGVNIDHIATLRQARGGFHPDPVEAAGICQKAGAHSIVMHLREDRRHVQDEDLFRVKKAIAIKLNLEMSMAPDIVRVALELRPGQVTLVPEKRRERTTEGGLDILDNRKRVEQCLRLFKKNKIPVSFFINPDLKQIQAGKDLGCGAIELHTGFYANAVSQKSKKAQLLRLKNAVDFSNSLGILTHVGHGLDYDNVGALTRLKGLEEFNIGYSIITRAVWVGLGKAVKEMREKVCGYRNRH